VSAQPAPTAGSTGIGSCTKPLATAAATALVGEPLRIATTSTRPADVADCSASCTQRRSMLAFNPRANATEAIYTPGCMQAWTAWALNSSLCRRRRLRRRPSSLWVSEVSMCPRRSYVDTRILCSLVALKVTSPDGYGRQRPGLEGMGGAAGDVAISACLPRGVLGQQRGPTGAEGRLTGCASMQPPEGPARCQPASSRTGCASPRAVASPFEDSVAACG
jgi:hypothetical protein